MVAVMVAAVAVLLVGGAGLVTLVRFVARRELAPVVVLVSGEVLPAPAWVPDALRDSVPTGADSWRWSSVEESGVLSGFKGEVRIPGQDVVLTAALQPHTHVDTFTSSSPLRVQVDLAEFSRRTGLQRLLYGQYPTKASMGLREALQGRIRDRARAAGARAKTTSRLKATTVAVGGSFVLLIVLALVAGTQLLGLPDQPGSTPTATPVGPPASATRCATPSKATGPPTRSASGNKVTGCPLAEAVRSAYLKKGAKGKQVTLAKVTRPKTKQRYDLTCKGAALVTCSGGPVVVYLY